MNRLPPEDEDGDEFNINTPTYEPYEDEQTPKQDTPEVEDYQLDSFDKLISARVSLPVAGTQQQGKVLRRKQDHDGKLIGMHSSNPYLDTSLYEIKFDDGHVESYAANLIAENIYKQLDNAGNKHCLIDEIIDHQKDNSAMSHEDSEYTFRGCTHQKRMTRGWFLCVQWKDDSMSWEHLHD